MAEVYKRVDGEKLTRYVARHERVQEVLQVSAEAVAFRAEMNLLKHRDTGRSHISVEKGIVDRYISLDDPNALAIEYGHKAYEYTRKSDGKKIKVGHSEGTRVMRDALEERVMSL